MPGLKFDDDHSYSLSGFQRAINTIVQWFFFYRMLWLIGAILTITVLGIFTWNSSIDTDKVKNLVAVLTGGSIAIGIFYAVLNYEMNYYKYRKDRISSKKQAAFLMASEWHKDSIVKNLKITKKLYERHKHLIEQNRSKQFSELLDADDEGRAALISIFNYLECIALGVEEGIHDEAFMKKFFRSIYISYNNNFEFYILYKRKKEQNGKIWIKFTCLAEKWRNEEPLT